MHLSLKQQREIQEVNAPLFLLRNIFGLVSCFSSLLDISTFTHKFSFQREWYFGQCQDTKQAGHAGQKSLYDVLQQGHLGKKGFLAKTTRLLPKTETVRSKRANSSSKPGTSRLALFKISFSLNKSGCFFLQSKHCFLIVLAK